MKAKVKGPRLLARCNTLTGSATVAALLFEIVQLKPTSNYDGRLWAPRSRAQLQEDTALTFHQVRRGLDRLRVLGLIETSQHLVSDTNGYDTKNILHVRVTEYGFEMLEG